VEREREREDEVPAAAGVEEVEVEGEEKLETRLRAQLLLYITNDRSIFAFSRAFVSGVYRLTVTCAVLENLKKCKQKKQN